MNTSDKNFNQLERNDIIKDESGRKLKQNEKRFISFVKNKIMAEYSIRGENIFKINLHHMTKDEARVYIEIELDSIPKNIQAVEVIHRLFGRTGSS